MEILSGKKIANEILADLQEVVFREKLTPKLAVILVGDDPASHLYVKLKKSAAEKIGAECQVTFFSRNVQSSELERSIVKLNQDTTVHGILLQLPLPDGLDENSLVQLIDPAKDADGFHQETIRRFLAGERSAEPVFPRAIATLIRSTHQKIQGEKAVALVNSELFGKALAQTLKNLGLSPTIRLVSECGERGIDLRDASVVVTACGRAKMITRDMLAPGTIVIDGGISLVEGQAVGDVDLESLHSLSGYISPVPGGVGPVTVASLLARVVEEARHITTT